MGKCNHCVGRDQLVLEKVSAVESDLSIFSLWLGGGT